MACNMALPSTVAEKLRRLGEAVPKWRELPDPQRALLARACKKQLATLPLDWAVDECLLLGIDPSKPDTGNTASTSPFVMIAVCSEWLGKAAEMLEGKLKVPEPKRQLPGGKSVYEMGNMNAGTPGCKLELIPSDVEIVDNASAHGDAAGVSVVLGAGNQSFLTIVDIIMRLFVSKECVLCKQHPLRAYLEPVMAHIFAPLAAMNAFSQCLDSELAGAHAALISNPLVTHIHVTGSGATHDKVMEALKLAGRQDAVEFTSELGCVTPWIVCPGTANGGVWKVAEIEHHAVMLAALVKANCSMNCCSPKVVVLPDGDTWPQRDEFLKVLRNKLAELPQVPPYYPGAHQRYANFKQHYPDGEIIESPLCQSGVQALTPQHAGQDFSALHTLLVDVGILGTDSCNNYALKNEAFAPVLAVATVKSASAADFPIAAAKAANEFLFGTLSCSLIWPDPSGIQLDATVQELNYGLVAVNMPSMLCYNNAVGTWGGSPGSYSKTEPCSGLGQIGNMARVPNAPKSVCISPFVNDKVAFNKPLPKVLADVLIAVIGGKSCLLPRIFGVLLGHCCGCYGKPLAQTSRTNTAKPTPESQPAVDKAIGA